MRQVDFIRFSLFLCCCLFLSGCETGFNERVPVSGTVSVDDKKLQRGLVSFISVDDPDVVEAAVVEDGVFECDLLTGEKLVRCEGSKVVGTYAPDPLFPDKVNDKLEKLPESAFAQEIKVNVKRKGDYFVIRYGDVPSNGLEQTNKRQNENSDVQWVEPSSDQSFKDVLPEL